MSGYFHLTPYGDHSRNRVFSPYNDHYFPRYPYINSYYSYKHASYNKPYYAALPSDYADLLEVAIATHLSNIFPLR